MKQSIPAPVAAALVAVVVLILGVFLFRQYTASSAVMSNPDDPRIQGTGMQKPDFSKMSKGDIDKFKNSMGGRTTSGSH